MYQKMAQSGGGGKFEKTSGTVTGLSTSSFKNIDCGFTPTHIIVFTTRSDFGAHVFNIHDGKIYSTVNTSINTDDTSFFSDYIQLTQNGFKYKCATPSFANNLYYEAFKYE